MNYLYYPGCSLKKNAAAYDESTLAVAGQLGIKFSEIDDWNCCGATEYIALELLPAYALVGRNLAIAADQSSNGDPLVAPCSACFLNLRKADHYLAESDEMAVKVNQALAAGGLHYEPGSIKVRHLLDVLVNDVDRELIRERVKKPLYELRVAPYYGCLVVRPPFSGGFDNSEYPITLDHLLQDLGAEIIDFPMKAHCCGGHMTQISEPVALDLIRRLLKNADDYEADVIATVCPMCQLNLDAYQDRVNSRFGTNFNIPILYFTQLIGLAFGLEPKTLGFGSEIVDSSAAISKIGAQPPKRPKTRAAKKGLPMPAVLGEV